MLKLDALVGNPFIKGMSHKYEAAWQVYGCLGKTEMKFQLFGDNTNVLICVHIYALFTYTIFYQFIYILISLQVGPNIFILFILQSLYPNFILSSIFPSQQQPCEEVG